MKEQWKPVKGFEGKYIVSNFGNVMSIPRVMERLEALHEDNSCS